jgi:hypothetical protein
MAKLEEVRNVKVSKRAKTLFIDPPEKLSCRKEELLSQQECGELIVKLGHGERVRSCDPPETPKFMGMICFLFRANYQQSQTPGSSAYEAFYTYSYTKAGRKSS